MGSKKYLQFKMKIRPKDRRQNLIISGTKIESIEHTLNCRKEVIVILLERLAVWVLRMKKEEKDVNFFFHISGYDLCGLIEIFFDKTGIFFLSF